jgi:putative ABC transport system substrate-binding protein
MRRRDFLSIVGASSATWPVAARAQRSALPVIGFLNSETPELFVDRLRGFRQGLKETGYVEGENVVIEYRWADSHADRLPALATDLVHRKVAVIAATGGTIPAVTVVKAATPTVPVVFIVPEDPVGLGLVASLSRPGGNATGINFFGGELIAKRLGLLRELVPKAVRVAVLLNPGNVGRSKPILQEVDAAARSMDLQIQVFHATNAGEIDTSFDMIARERPDALFVAPDPLFFGRRVQLAILAARHAIPTTYPVRDNAVAGGLMSYGSDVTDAYRQVAVYVGRVLKGAKPADLPVIQATKFELVINARTAKAIGLAVPPALLARADEVIE